MSSAPRFRIIVERPVRTVSAYDKRKAKAQREARNAELQAGIKAREEKTS